MVLTADGTDGRGLYGSVVMGIVHSDLSKSIIGASMTVLNELKPGLDEKLYENALMLELRER